MVRRLSTRALRSPRAHATAPARRLGKPAFDLHGQGELSALTYSLGGLAVVAAWLLVPGDIGNRAGMATLLAFVFARGRRHLRVEEPPTSLHR